MASIPAQIGPYRVLGLLGAGGMGSVFKAESSQRQIVALKMIGHLTDTGSRFRPGSALAAFNRSRRVALIREARLSMELVHPNIVRVLDYGQHQGLLYLVMEFLEGQTLLSALQNASPKLQQRLLWLAAICDALTFAHGRGVIHRDLHVNNVFVLRDGTIKLLDFGLARRVGDPVLPGHIAGVLPFLAPEILEGRPLLSSSTDIWSAGVLLCVLLRGNMMFGYQGLRQFTANMLNGPSPLLDPAHPCAADLQQLISHALESNPERRVPSAARFAAELRRVAAKAGHLDATSPDLTISSATASVPPSPIPVPIAAQPSSVSVSRRANRPRLLQRKLEGVDIPQYLKTTAMTLFSGLMLVGYLQPRTELPFYAIGAASALALLPILLLFPANLLLAFAAALAELQNCRSCRGSMRRVRDVTQYAMRDTAVSLGIADSLGCLEAGLWDDAGRLLSLHGQDCEPLLPRNIADAPLRLHLGLFACDRCRDECAIFNVQEHREDCWVTRAGYVAAYRHPRRRRDAQMLPLRSRFRYGFLPIYEAARVSLATIRLSIVQGVCAAGLLFMIWFTWAYLHQGR